MFLCLIILIFAPSCLSSTLVKRMAGGKPGQIEEYPYLVLVNPRELLCSGAILSQHYVLTAAHCILSNLTDMFVEAGSTYFGLGSRHHFTLKDVSIHKNYRVYDDSSNLQNAWNDIAVIRVQEPFIYDNTRQPIRLADRGYKIEVNATAKGAGWGMNERDVYPNQFNKMDLHVIDKKSCRKLLRSSGGFDSRHQFCATTCNKKQQYYHLGDSGSSLVLGNRAVGVTSNGFIINVTVSIVVFTEVSFYRDWIDDHVVHDDPENTHFFNDTNTYTDKQRDFYYIV